MTQERLKTESVSYPTPGDILDGRYRLEEILNAGGMGVIMRARQLAMDRDVAVKLLLPSKVDREITRTRFEREVHLAKQLTHPNIIRLYDYGKHDKFLYIVMELLDGQDLKGLLRKQAPLPVGRALDIAVQIADALTDAHRRNIVHRDLKPGNIFIQKLGSNRDFVKVLDFGIAKSLDSHEFDVTSTGEVSGTVAYIAPEIVRGAIPGKVADVYAVGVLLLEMITGRRVFEGHTVAETLMNHLERPPPMPPSIANTKLAGVLQIALAKKPEERYSDAQALLMGLNGVAPTISPTLRLSEGEIQACFGDAPRFDGQTSGDVVPSDDGSGPRSGTQLGYAVSDMPPTQITPAEVSEDAVQRANTGEAQTQTTDSRPGGRRRVPWKAAGVVLALFIFGAVAGDWLWNNARRSPEQRDTAAVSEQEPEPKPEPEPRAVTVMLRTSPSGARVVTAEGEVLGETPLTAPLRGPHVLEFELEGHQTHTAVIDPATASKLEIELDPEVTEEQLLATATEVTHQALDAATDRTNQEKEEVEEKPKRRRNTRKRRPKPKPRKVARAEKKESEPDQTDEDDSPAEEDDGGLDIFPDQPEKKPEPPPEKTADELYEEARQHFIGGSYREAISSCKKAARKGVSKCHALMANSYRLIGNMEQACKYYDRAGIEHKSCLTLQNR